MEALKLLSRSEMKDVRGGLMDGGCHLYCCDSSGNCSNSFPQHLSGSGGCTSNEQCQSDGATAGYSCSEGTYLAGLCY